jgi:hypothetical protein
MQSSISITNVGTHSCIDKKLIFFVFSFFLIINIMTTGGHFDWHDGIEAFLVTESMALKHSAKLYPNTPSALPLLGKALIYSQNLLYQPYYTYRPILLAAISVPFYYTATILSVDPKVFIGVFANSLMITLISLTIFCFSLEIYGSRKIAFILSVIFTLCSFVLPYNTTFYSQPLQALCIIAAAFFIYKSLHSHFSYLCYYYRPNNNNGRGIYYAAIGGLFLGLSIFAHPTSVIVLPGFIAYSVFYMRRNRKNLGSFLVSLFFILSLMGFVNYIRFGSFTDFGYGSFGSLAAHNGWKGLIGLLVSPGAGLLLYFPAVVLFPIALKYVYRKDRGLFFLIAYITVVNWLYFGTTAYGGFYWEPITWSGGLSWGPRYLISILPFITIAFGTLLTHLRNNNKRKLLLKYSIITLSAVGFIINLLGTLVWIHYDWTYKLDWLKEWNWSSDYHVVTWNPYYSAIVLDVKILMDNYVSHIVPEKYANTGWHYVTLGLAPCSYDTYVFCKFGIMPILGLALIDVVLAILIIKDTDNILYLPQFKYLSRNLKVYQLICRYHRDK